MRDCSEFATRMREHQTAVVANSQQLYRAHFRSRQHFGGGATDLATLLHVDQTLSGDHSHRLFINLIAYLASTHRTDKW